MKPSTYNAALTRLKAEALRIDKASEKLMDQRHKLALTSCPWLVGDTVLLGLRARRCRVTWVAAPPSPHSNALWRMLVKPLDRRGKMLKTATWVYSGELVKGVVS